MVEFRLMATLWIKEVAEYVYEYAHALLVGHVINARYAAT
jgi:hypothetical protein